MVEAITSRLCELREEGLSGSTANRYLYYLSAIFLWGIQQGKISTNPAAQVQSFRESDPIVRFLSEEEEDGIRQAIRDEYPDQEAEFDIALHCGLRRNELYRLTWDKVDLERELVTVQGKQHANSNRSSRRYVPINSKAVLAFRRLNEQSGGSVYVCPGRQMGADTDRDWHRWFERSVVRAGVVNFRYHDLRHTFASRLVMAGVPLAAVKEYMGHSSIAMTMRYAHLAPDYQRNQIEKLVSEYGPKLAEGKDDVKVVNIAGKKAKKT
jgi:integrase